MARNVNISRYDERDDMRSLARKLSRDLSVIRSEIVGNSADNKKAGDRIGGLADANDALEKLVDRSISGKNEEFNAVIADVVSADFAHIQDGVIDNATIEHADVNGLNANYAHITNGAIDNANIDVANVNNLDAHYAHITNGTIDNATIGHADVNGLDANYAHIKDGVIDNATIDHASVNGLDANYAEIDLANVSNAWIEKGVIKDAAISDAQIIGVSANKLTAGTIDASKIYVTNLNADNITVGTINGKRIGNASIDLSKLAEEVPTKEYLDSVQQSLQGQIDGQIETWTSSEIPLLSNYPASSWTDQKTRKAHVGDVLYVVNAASDADGYCYRFSEDSSGTFSWVLIKDSDVTKALKELIDVQGDVHGLKSFQSETSSWIANTDEELSSIKTNQTSLETSLGKKVETSVFNELRQTVGENSASITSLTNTVETKADGSTVTALSNTVNSVKQTADSNTASISNLSKTVSDNKTEIESRASSIEQNLSGFKSTVSKTYATTTALANAKNEIVSMGEQLVINGSGLMGNNTNFSSLIFDASKANGSAGSFTRNGTNYTILSSDQYFTVDPNLRYSFELDAMSMNGLASMYSFLDFYDVDKKKIIATDHVYIAGTLTTLARDLKDGDTVVYLTDLTNWNVNVNTGDNYNARSFIFWNYTNSFGYTYPEETYSRNHYKNLYQDSGVNKTAKTITLTNAWKYGTVPAGTKVSQNYGPGATFKYQAMGDTKPPTEWKHYSGYYDGTDYSGKNVSSKFPPGTAYARVGFLWNYNKAEDQVWVTNISVKTDYNNAIQNVQNNLDAYKNTVSKTYSTKTELSQTDGRITALSGNIYTKTEINNKGYTTLTEVQKQGYLTVNSDKITSMVSATTAAKTAADAAQSDADVAKEAADKAQEDVDALTNRMTTAETKIEQNTDAIELRATKTEAQGYANTAKSDAISSASSDATAKANKALSDAKSFTTSQGYLTVGSDKITAMVSATTAAQTTADNALELAGTKIDESAAINITKNQIKNIVISPSGGTTATQSPDGFTWTISSPTVPTKVSQLDNDSSFQTESQVSSAADNAAKTATDFMRFSAEEGLTIGDYSSDSLSGASTNIKPDGMRIYDPSSNELAHFLADEARIANVFISTDYSSPDHPDHVGALITSHNLNSDWTNNRLVEVQAGFGVSNWATGIVLMNNVPSGELSKIEFKWCDGGQLKQKRAEIHDLLGYTTQTVGGVTWRIRKTPYMTEAWATVTRTITSGMTDDGAWGYYVKADAVNYPTNLFSSVPKVMISARGPYGYPMLVGNGTSAATPDMFFYRPTNADSFTVYFDLYVIGE